MSNRITVKGRRGKRATKRFRKRKIYKNPLGRGIPNSMRKFRANITAEIPIACAGTTLEAVMYPQVAVPLNFPTMATIYNGAAAATYGQITTAGSQISSNWVKLIGEDTFFDEYRVLRLVCKFYPVTQITSTTTYQQTHDDPYVMYHYNDLDDVGVIVTPSIEGKYLNEGAKTLSYIDGKPKGFIYRQLKSKKNRYLNSAATLDYVPGTAVGAAGTPFENPFSSMKLMWPTHKPASSGVTYIGRLYVTWDCIFRGINMSTE